MPPKPAPRRGRPPGITASRLIKRIVITGAVHQRIKIAQVARDLGVPRSWASREAHDPETHDLLAALDKTGSGDRGLLSAPCAEGDREPGGKGREDCSRPLR